MLHFLVKLLEQLVPANLSNILLSGHDGRALRSGGQVRARWSLIIIQIFVKRRRFLLFVAAAAAKHATQDSADHQDDNDDDYCSISSFFLLPIFGTTISSESDLDAK
jgi:hypothetical protein